MSRPYRQTDFEKETKNFEAFDQLTTALTLIDNYQSSQHKDKKLLDQAAVSITKSLVADKDYFKAQYFQAVVKYLQGDKDAVNAFSSLLKLNPASDVRNEIKYNIAVANSEHEHFMEAIGIFYEVIDAPADPETKLLAYAGLALTYAKRIEHPEYKNAEIQDQDRQEIKTQWQRIQNTLASTQGRLINNEVKKEVERIMARALNETVELPHRRRRKLARVLRRFKLILFVVVIIILLILIPYLYLYYGIHNTFGR